MGGTRSETVNLPSNLLLLCQPCHAWVESNRETAYDQGYLVRRTVSDIAAVPVLLHHGLMLLTNDGAYVAASGQ